MIVFWMFSVLLAEILGLVLASKKNRSIIGWFFIILIFGWIGVLIVGVMPALKSKEM